MDQIVERLDRLVAITRLAHAEALASAGASVRKDRVKAAVLDACESGWVGAGKLQKLVMRETDAANSTVRAHIAELLDRGLLAKRGGGPTTEYRSTGLL